MADPITIVTVDETTNITTTSYSTNAVPWNPFNQQIKAVNISDGITSISEYAFWWLTQIESITIPDSVLTVGRQSFVHCSKLQTVTFGENLTTIGEEAFKDCTALKEIYLSNKLTSIEESAFTGCESLTDVYYEGSESEWEDIGIETGNDSLVNAEIHYNYKEEPWTPDGTFSISKSGTWVSGKECALYGTYSAFTPGNAEAEANEIVWVSSDTSILDVSETIIDFNVADEENNHVSIQKTFTAKKAGTVTITATAPDGRSTSVTIDVEPELVAVGTEKLLAEKTKVTLFQVMIEEPDAEYLEKFISQVDVELSDDDNGAAIMCNQSYKVAEDALSAQITVILDPLYDGTIKIKGSSTGGQEISVEIKTDTDNLRPGEIGYFWLDSDEWSFTNSSSENAFGADTAEGYYITQEDYDRLISKLSNTEKNVITFSQNLANATTQGINIYRYNIDGLSTNAHDEWEGSCYGMSAWACLVKNDTLNANDIDPFVNQLNNYSCNRQVESAINYYHMQQLLPNVQKEKEKFLSNSADVRLQILEERCADFINSEKPVLIGFSWISEFNQDGSPKKTSGHAIVGYGIENIQPTQIDVLESSYEYNHRILTYDCAVGTDTFIYYNDEGYWCIPDWEIISDPFKSELGIYDECNNGILNFAIADPMVIDSVNYRTGESSTENNTDTKLTLTTEADAGYNIKTSDYSADIRSFIISNYSGNGQINISIDANITANGKEASTTATAYLPQSDYYRISSAEDGMAYQLNSANYLTSIFMESSGNIMFRNNGSVKYWADDSTKYSISLTANDGYCKLPWYMVQISGDNAYELSAEWTNDGVLVTGDNLENVTIIGSNDDDTQEMTFSTDEDSVLISESDNELIALLDTDDDGVYDTDINEKEEHIHSYAIPEFIWSDDYQTCTAVFTCESCDNQQKVECDITSGTTNPTCTEDGKTVYTATVSFADKEYTDTQEEVITATGHTYEYVDNGDGTHTKVCTAGDDMVNEPHTYQNGTCAYCGAEEPKRQEATENKPSQSNRPLQGNTPAAVRIPVIGTMFMDRASGARYQVTKAGIENKGAVTGAEVAYVEPATNARQIVIPEYVSFDGVRYKVTTVLENAFRSNKTVTKIKIGNNVISIGANAFSGCKKLKSVVIGKNVATIGNNAFKKCTAIKKVIIPAKVTFIGKNAFVGCKQLKNIIVKTKLLRKIGKNAFKGINKMAKIKVPKKQFKKYQKLFKKAKLAKNIRIAK